LVGVDAEPALEYAAGRSDFHRWVGVDVNAVEVTVAIEEFLEKGSKREVGVCEEEEGNLGLGIGGGAQVGVRGARAHEGKAGGLAEESEVIEEACQREDFMAEDKEKGVRRGTERSRGQMGLMIR